jgi:putative transcriptional regulator
MANVATPEHVLAGQLLVAMPQMTDPRFQRSVIYMCAHSPDGAMGIVVNRLIDSLSFPDLLRQLSIDPLPASVDTRVHFGGPVEGGRGFVLHTADYIQDNSMMVEGGIALTATVDILRAIAEGRGPRSSLLALGYAGWAPGQLESEIQQNGWLVVPADEHLVFGKDVSTAWERAIGKLGVNPTYLTGVVGHA